MTRIVPLLSTEQVAAFVELARVGSLQAAAASLRLSSEGLRGRILALENALGTSLYEKERGRRGDVRLTPAGRRFVQKAMRFIEQAQELTGLFEPRQETKEIQLIGSHYLMANVMMPAIGEFRQQYPAYGLRLSTRAESQVLGMLSADLGCALGICTPTDFPPGLHYVQWRITGWALAVPDDHRWAREESVSLAQIALEPLIVFERSSAGRLHVLEAFYALGLAPLIRMEATSTPLILSMVAARLGVALVPASASGSASAGMPVAVVPLSDPIRPIETGIFFRDEWRGDPVVQALLKLIMATSPAE